MRIKLLVLIWTWSRPSPRWASCTARSSTSGRRGISGRSSARTRATARVPLATAKACLDALRISLLVADKGNVNSASDAGVAALMARAGVEGAVLNVLINLGSVKDVAFRQECLAGTENLVLEATHLCEQVIARVKGTFKKA